MRCTIPVFLLLAATIVAQEPIPSVKAAREARAKASELEKKLNSLKDELATAQKAFDAEDKAAKDAEDAARKDIEKLSETLKASQEALSSPATSVPLPKVKETSLPLPKAKQKISKSPGKLKSFDPMVKEAEVKTDWRLVVKVPEGARVLFNGKPTGSNDKSDRTFVIHELDPAKKYNYMIRVEWGPASRTEYAEREVEVAPGTEMYLELLPESA